MNAVVDVIALLAFFAVGAQAGGITMGDAGADKVSADKAAEAVSDSIRDLFGLPTEPALDPKPAVVPQPRKTAASRIAKAAGTKPDEHTRRPKLSTLEAVPQTWLTDFDPVHGPRKAETVVKARVHELKVKPDAAKERIAQSASREGKAAHTVPASPSLVQKQSPIFAQVLAPKTQELQKTQVLAPHPKIANIHPKTPEPRTVTEAADKVVKQVAGMKGKTQARYKSFGDMLKEKTKENFRAAGLQSTGYAVPVQVRTTHDGETPANLRGPVVSFSKHEPAAPPPSPQQVVQKQSPIFAHAVTTAEQDDAILYIKQQDDAAPVAATAKRGESVVMTMTLVPTEKTPFQSTNFNTGFGSPSWLGERIASSTQPWLGERIRSALSHFFWADSATPADTATSPSKPVPKMSDISAPHPSSDNDLYGGGLYVPRDLKLVQSSQKVISGQSLIQSSTHDISGKSAKQDITGISSRQDFKGTADAVVEDSLANMDIHEAWVTQEQESNEAVELVKREDRALRLAAATVQKPVTPVGGVNLKGSTHISGFFKNLALQDQAMIKSLDQGGEDITQYGQMLQLQNAKVEAAVGDTERHKIRHRNAGDV